MEFNNINSKAVIEEICKQATEQNRLDVINNDSAYNAMNFSKYQEFIEILIRSGNPVIKAFVNECVNRLKLDESKHITFTIGIFKTFGEYVVCINIGWFESFFLENVNIQFTNEDCELYEKKQHPFYDMDDFNRMAQHYAEKYSLELFN